MLRQPLILFFSDSKCETPILHIRFDGITLTGTKSTPMVVWAKNISGHELINVEIHIINANGIDDPDITVEPYKVGFFPPDAMQLVTISFHPSPTRTEPLRGEIQVSCVMVKRA